MDVSRRNIFIGILLNLSMEAERGTEVERSDSRLIVSRRNIPISIPLNLVM